MEKIIQECCLPTKNSKITEKALNHEELERICNLDLEKETLNQARDIFIFQCFTGMRFCELEQLFSQNIKKGKNGTYTIQLISARQNDKISHQLEGRAVNIYKKYVDHTNKKSRLLPIPSFSVYCKSLKELARLAGLKQIDSHTARKTYFVTTSPKTVDEIISKS